MSRETMSIYIPVMSLYYDENKVKEVFEILGLGYVHHVDFVETGRVVNGKKTCSAFVYLSYWYDTFNANELYETICYDTPNLEEKIYHFYVDCTEYWLFLKNTNPNNDVNYDADYDVDYCEDYDMSYGMNYDVDYGEDYGMNYDVEEEEQITGTHTRFMELFGQLFECVEGFVVGE